LLKHVSSLKHFATFLVQSLFKSALPHVWQSQYKLRDHIDRTTSRICKLYTLFLRYTIFL